MVVTAMFAIMAVDLYSARAEDQFGRFDKVNSNSETRNPELNSNKYITETLNSNTLHDGSVCPFQ